MALTPAPAPDPVPEFCPRILAPTLPPALALALPPQSPAQKQATCAGVPFRARLFTNSWECAKYDRQKAGSE